MGAAPFARSLAAAALGALCVCAHAAKGSEPRSLKCEEQWSISINGVSLGQSREAFEIDSRGALRARSSMSPSGLPKLLGAPDFKREAFGSAGLGLSKRIEEKASRSKSEDSTWERQADGSFSRTGSDGSRHSAEPAPPGALAVDVPLLNRLASMGALSQGREAELLVFSMGSTPTKARAKMNGPRRFTVESSDLKATVELDADSNPVSVELTDGKQSIKSILASGGCRRSPLP